MDGSNKEKILKISTSALVGLKAALYSKQQAAKKEKKNGVRSDDSHTRQISEKTASLWKRTGKAKSQKSAKKQVVEETHKELSQQEERELERSRKALEAKAALYEKLSKGKGLKEAEGQDGEESRYMVDFTRKVYEEVKDNRNEPTVGPSPMTTGTPLANEVSPSQQDADNDEWTEYEDEFGRTRRCLKSELPEKTKRLERSPTPQLLSEDMRRERERVQWERTVEEEESESAEPLHYQSVRKGEIRNHGVGFYQFSEKEEERKKQMEELSKLTDQTETERDKKQRLKEKRRALMEARLNKVKEKRNKQRREQGLADIEFEIGSSKKSDEVNSDDIRALLDEELEKSKANSCLAQEKFEEEKRSNHIRPWDKGKVVDIVRKRKQELEEERLPEFAPPPSYAPDTKKPKTEPDVAESTSTFPPPPPISSVHGNASQSFVPPPPPPWLGFMPPPPFQWQYPYAPPPMGYASPPMGYAPPPPPSQPAPVQPAPIQPAPVQLLPVQPPSQGQQQPSGKPLASGQPPPPPPPPPKSQSLFPSQPLLAATQNTKT